MRLNRRRSMAAEVAALGVVIRSLNRSLRRLVPILSAAAGNGRAQIVVPARRGPRLSRQHHAALVLQGRYMGYMRQLKPSQKVQVRKIREAKGVRVAIAKARGLVATAR